MNKVLILGPAASGKSTFARKLARHMESPVVHQDALFFAADGSAIDQDIAGGLVVSHAGDGDWVVEGNYAKIVDLILPMADTVIFLDFGPWGSLYRVVKRWLVEAVGSL